MLPTFATFLEDGEAFFRALFDELSRRIASDSLKAPDHLCFRVGTPEEYREYKGFLMENAELLTEAPVNGRPICTFRLRRPFRTATGDIPLVELPAPKLGTDYDTGFEHAEFVVDEPFAAIQARYPQLEFHSTPLKALNQELTLRLDRRSAKFHYLRLDRVIEIEEAPLTDIVFDFDGTIIDSRDTIHRLNAAVFSRMLRREVASDEAREKFSPEFKRLFENFGINDASRVARGIELWSETSQSFEYDLFEGVRETLRALAAGPRRLHLWTARDERSCRRILARHELDSIWTTMSFAQRSLSKPDPDSLLFDHRSAPPHSVLMIGDTPTDMKAGQNIRAIRGAALWETYADHSALLKSGAELFFRHPSEVTLL